MCFVFFTSSPGFSIEGERTSHGPIEPYTYSHPAGADAAAAERRVARRAHARAPPALALGGHDAGAGGSRGRGTGHSLDTAVSSECPASRPLLALSTGQYRDAFGFARECPGRCECALSVRSCVSRLRVFLYYRYLSVYETVLKGAQFLQYGTLHFPPPLPCSPRLVPLSRRENWIVGVGILSTT